MAQIGPAADRLEETRSHRSYGRLLVATRWCLFTLIVFGTVSSLITFSSVVPTWLHLPVRVLSWVVGGSLFAWSCSEIRRAAAELRQGLQQKKLPSRLWLMVIPDLVSRRPAR